MLIDFYIDVFGVWNGLIGFPLLWGNFFQDMSFSRYELRYGTN